MVLPPVATVRRGRLRSSLRVRAMIAFAVGAAIVAAVLSSTAYLITRSYLVDQRESVGRRNAYLNARLVRDVLRTPEGNPARVLGSLQREEGSHALFRARGRWYASSISVSPARLPAELVEIVDRGDVANQKLRIGGEPHLAVGVALPSVDVAYFELVPLRQLDRTLRTLGAALVGAAGATTLLGAAVGFFLTGRLVRPLRRLAAQAEALASGHADRVDETTADEELRPLVAALNRAIETIDQRAERGARMASDVSHELRAPLAALSAAVQVMQRRRAQLPERTVVALDALSAQVDGFQQLVLDLLEMAKVDAGRAELELEPVDLLALVRSALVSVGADTVEIHADASLPSRLQLDRRRVSQMIVNLVENARRYAGGATDVHLLDRGDAVEVVVEDRGPGVAHGERERIFERFHRGAAAEAPDAPSGTGLGLALVLEHARLHGGSVRVEDRDGGGARFVIALPRTEP